MRECVTANVTILFISDGNDNDMTTLQQRLDDEVKGKIDKSKKVNFLSVGVGKEFPTFLAMKLREMYHTGEKSVPPVFLIEETNSAEVWAENYALLEPYLRHNQAV